MKSIPYTYLIGWSKLNCWYYGCQHKKNSHPSNLWTLYYTSSEYVKQMRTLHGEPNIIQIRKTFKKGKDALIWEEKVLRRIKAVQSSKWLNKGNAGAQFNSCAAATREKIRKSRLGKPAWNKGKPNPVAREYMTKNNPMKNPEIALRMRIKKLRAVAHNKQKITFVWKCETCQKEETRYITKTNKTRFCDRSCQAKTMNKTRKRYISHPTNDVQASS